MATKNIFSLSPSDTPLLSSSGLTGGSIKDNIRINNEIMPDGFSGRADACRRMTGLECGRSMVEMLSVLAIIGVLSVGAIGGYSYAMDKYRANEIINDIMLRSVDVIAQYDITGDANLSEWPTTTAGKYTIGLENETIGIQVDRLEKRLCEMVFDGMINQATVKIGDTMYDSVTDNPICGDTNTMVFYVDETDDWEEVTEKETEPETETQTDTEEETETTTTATETDTDVETTTTGMSCDGCNNCGENQYCADTNESCTEANPCECRDLDFSEYTIDGTTYYVSNSYMTWWDADAACKAMNKTMITVPELVTNTDGSTWTSGTGTKKRTALAEQLYSQSGKRYAWTSNLYNNLSNSCNA